MSDGLAGGRPSNFVAVYATGKGPPVIVDRYLVRKEVSIHDDDLDGFVAHGQHPAPAWEG